MDDPSRPAPRFRLFNTRTERTEPFTGGHEVGLYVCGVTPYDTTHLGHARTYLVFDVLARYMIDRGHRLRYVQNITDIDDSIIERARQTGTSYEDLAARYTIIYLEDVATLGMLPASTYPRATEAIGDMQTMISRLLERGFAYRVDGEIYFRVSASDHFGELSRLSRQRMLEIEEDQDAPSLNDPRKEDALDFLLWRASDRGEPAWASPWGPGRPGWHIECSTLSLTHLGDSIDVHGGGDDLVYPHHECEIAQSEALTGIRPFVRLWMHVAMVRLDGAKMAKSRGNVIFVRELLDEHSPDAIRLYLLSTHYRTPLDVDEYALGRHAEVARLMAKAARQRVSTSSGGNEIEAKRAWDRFRAALDADLDIPGAIRETTRLAEIVLSGPVSYESRRLLRNMASLLGLSLDERS